MFIGKLDKRTVDCCVAASTAFSTKLAVYRDRYGRSLGRLQTLEVSGEIAGQTPRLERIAIDEKGDPVCLEDFHPADLRFELERALTMPA